jgi:transglutaminase-like putative cysteine protease
MAWKSVVVAGLLAQSSLVAAQDQQAIAIAPAPGWAALSEPLEVPADTQGLTFLRRQDTFVRLTANGHDLFSSQMIHILQPQALEIGNIAIGWNPAAGEARVHKVVIHRRGQTIDVLGKTGFEILRREDQLEAAMLDGLLTAVLRVPDLRVGDDLEIAYTVPLHDPTLRDASHGLLFIGEAPPPGRYRLELSWEDGQKPRTLVTPDLAGLVTQEPNRIAVRLDNPAAITPPRDAPPRYAWQRIIEFSDFADWPTVSRRFHTLFAEASKLDAKSPLREEAAAIKASTPDQLGQAQAALELVQQQVRYVYVGLNGGNFTPATADATWERRYGDCKGKTAMLLALLGELGIAAEAVLVNNSESTDGLEQRLANPGMFDHVLVRARIGGKTVWLDGTLPEVIEGRADPFLPYQWVLPLLAKGAALERLPEKPFALPQVMELYEIDATAGFDAPAKWTRTTVLRGAEGLQQHLQFSSVSSGQLETAVKSQLTGSAAWDTVDTINYRFDRATQAAIFTIIGTGPVEWEEEDALGRYLRLPRGGFNPPSRRQRGAAGDSGAGGDVPFYRAPEYRCDVTTVRLPADTAITDWSFNSVLDTMLFGETYYRMMELRDKDRTLRLVRGYRVEQSEIAPDWAERDNKRLADFDNSMAILSYSPGAVGERWTGDKPIPAITEFDWAGESPPCLPADMLPRKG